MLPPGAPSRGSKYDRRRGPERPSALNAFVEQARGALERGDLQTAIAAMTRALLQTDEASCERIRAQVLLGLSDLHVRRAKETLAGPVHRRCISRALALTAQTVALAERLGECKPRSQALRIRRRALILIGDLDAAYAAGKAAEEPPSEWSRPT